MLVLLSGVSGAGKDTIKKELIARMDNVESLPSFTDRAPRENDIPGKTYNFVSTEEFEAMIARGELYEYSAHHNHYYGTSRKLLNEKMQNGKIIVKDIEVNGVENLVKLLGNDTKIVTIFLKVPKEELRRRLESRIDKPSPKDIELRLNRLQYEESKIGIYDYVIKNNNLEKTVNIIMEIIKSEYNMTEAEF
ncbi:transcriptional regulator XRE family [Clostridium sp. CAG:508]|jgi:guanylate kinase|nr:AAA family ATPase [Clostridia bacterium]CDC31810.1 transcriptional regulator XRE family [Clostridium sp. CAG:508]